MIQREIEQTLIFNVDMVPETADVRRAAASDDLADALDYSAVAAAIATVVRAGKFRLIETAAERIWALSTNSSSRGNRRTVRYTASTRSMDFCHTSISRYELILFEALKRRVQETVGPCSLSRKLRTKN